MLLEIVLKISTYTRGVTYINMKINETAYKMSIMKLFFFIVEYFPSGTVF